MSCPTSIKLNALRSGMTESEADAAVKIVDIIEATFPTDTPERIAEDYTPSRIAATPTGICK